MVGASASPENMPCASVSPDAGLVPVPVCVQRESLEPMEVRPDVSLAFESFKYACARKEIAPWWPREANAVGPWTRL